MNIPFSTILVTGGAGFIGSAFLRIVLAETNCTVLNLDALTYAGNPDNLRELAPYEAAGRYRFIKGDICDKALVDKIFTDYPVDAVVHFAAESHVDRSIFDPTPFLRSNVEGTGCLLAAARNHWSLRPDDPRCRDYKPGVRYLQVSTDEVYGTLPELSDPAFCETTPLAPNSPYSASKAAADLLVRSYRNTYGLPTLITRCSNNYGPRQFPEKLIPLMIRNCVEGKPLPVYGDGMQIRDWLYVDDHCRGILAVLCGGEPGEIYNIGGGNEHTNLEIVRIILAETGRDESLIEHVPDRPGHDRRYAIDSRKLRETLGWKQEVPFEEGIRATVRWYLDHPEWVERILSGAYRA